MVPAVRRVPVAAAAAAGSIYAYIMEKDAKMREPDDGRSGRWLLAGTAVDLRLRQAPAGRANSIHLQVERLLLLFGEGSGVGEEACPLDRPQRSATTGEARGVAGLRQRPTSAWR